MTQAPKPSRSTPRPLAAQLAPRFKQLRKIREWSAQRLADRCAEVGYPHLTRDVIASIETGRRADITVDELAVLTYVLTIDPQAPEGRVTALLAIAGVEAARAGGPAFLGDPQVWLSSSERLRWEREFRVLDAINEFKAKLDAIYGSSEYESDNETEGS